MKILVLSDSHGNIDNMRLAIERESPGLIIHLGDCQRDAGTLEREYPAIRLWKVRGNCDFGGTAPESGLDEVDGVRIFFAHGHRHGVKMGLDSFANSVCFSGSALGLYGHTHRAQHDPIANMELLNPGSIGDGLRPTYATVTTAGKGVFSCRIHDLYEEEYK